MNRDRKAARRLATAICLTLLGVNLVACTSRSTNGASEAGSTTPNNAAPDSPASRSTANNTKMWQQAGLLSGAIWGASRSEIKIVSATTTNASQTIAMPAGVMASQIASVQRDRAGHLGIAVSGSAGVRVYLRHGKSWVAASDSIHWPAGWNIPERPSSVTFAPTANDGVHLVASANLTATQQATAVFAVAGNAKGLDQQGASVWYPLISTVWLSTNLGVAVAGPSGHLLAFTSDGGAHWSLSTTTGVDVTAPGISYAGLTLVGADVQVVSVLPHPDGSETATILRSRDDGKSFADVGGPLVLPAAITPSDVAVATVDDDTWVIPSVGGVLFSTGDRGQTWSTIEASSLPMGIIAASAESSSSLVVEVTSTSCTEYKADCTTADAFYRSADDGQHWQPA